MKKNIIIVTLIVLAISASIYFFHLKKAQPVSTTIDNEMKIGNEMLSDLKGRGEALYKIKRYQGIIALYEGMLKDINDPLPIKNKLSELYFELGKIELDSGDILKAKLSLEKALVYDPEKIDAKRLIETIK